MGCTCSRRRIREPPNGEAVTAGRGGIPGKKTNVTVLIPRGETIRSIYKLGPVLGSGSFGQVRACTHRRSEQEYACKIMTKYPTKRRSLTSQHSSASVDYVGMFRNEIEILKSIEHPNVVNLIEAYEDKYFLYAVIDKCNGGELFTKIVQRRRLTESDASRLCRDMINAIDYIHSQKIVHRDIKAENFLFMQKVTRDANKITGEAVSRRGKHKESVFDLDGGAAGSLISGNNRLVLIDFGMSVKLADDSKYLKQVCGSPHYVAPELIKRRYNKEVDLWALGVIVFLMLYGRYPFEGSDQTQIAHKILGTEPDYMRGSRTPSLAAIDFIKGLLQKDPQRRLSPQSAAEHKWIISQGRQVPDEIPSMTLTVTTTTLCGPGNDDELVDDRPNATLHSRKSKQSSSMSVPGLKTEEEKNKTEKNEIRDDSRQHVVDGREESKKGETVSDCGPVYKIENSSAPLPLPPEKLPSSFSE